MKCPNCGNFLQLVRSKSHYGQSITLDQCPNCGGIWFDKNEYHQIKKTEIEKISQLNTNKLMCVKSQNNRDWLCPKDQTPLVVFKDSNFPKAIDVRRCAACSGFWFSCESVAAYSSEFPKKAPITDYSEDPIVRVLVANHKARNAALTSLSDFLNMRINPGTMKPEDWGPLPPYSEASNEYMEEAKNTYYLTAYFLNGLFSILR